MLCLHLKQRLLSALRTAAPLPSASLYRICLSTTASATPPAGFLAEDYLVASCGLTPAQAQKASKYLAHLRSPVRPDAVRAFLVGIGLTEADVVAAVGSYPKLLLSHRVDETLTPRVGELRELGLSPPQISSLITLAPEVLFSPVKLSRLAFYISFLGSYDRVHCALKKCYYLLRQDLDNVVRPNIAFLRQCGLTDYDIGHHCLMRSRILLSEPQRLKEIAVRVEELGLPRNSVAFKNAMVLVYSLNKVRLNARLSFLRNTIGCSEAEVSNMLCKMPTIISISESKLGRTMEFLKVEVGLEPSYVLNRPAIFGYSIEKRLMPRHYVIRILKAKGLLNKEIDFYTVVCATEERFLERFILPYNKSSPGLIEAYAAACRGQVTPELQL